MSMTDVGPDISLAWDRTCRQLRAELGQDVYDSWFPSVQAEGIEGEKFKLSVATRFLRSWIKEHYGEKVLTLVKHEIPTITGLEINLRSARGICVYEAPPPPPEPSSRGVERVLQKPLLTLEGFPTLALRSEHTFEVFSRGTSNEIPLMVMRQIAEKGRAVPLENPVYLYGANGVGKTHLLQGLVAEARTNGHKAFYTTAQQFVTWKRELLKRHSFNGDALLGVEILVIDDLDLLTGKEPLAVFARSLDGLLARHFVVLGSAREQSELPLEGHVLSRISAGMSLKIEMPDVGLRADILQGLIQKARHLNPLFSIPEDHLARLTTQEWATPRDLCGVIQKLLMHLSVMGEAEVTGAVMEKAVWQKLAEQSSPQRIRIEDIIRVVSKHYGVSRVDLMSSRRTANVVRPRQVAMYLAKTLTLRSLPEIGRRFGGRDHTTVLHAVRKIEGLVQKDRILRDEVGVITKQICPIPFALS